MYIRRNIITATPPKVGTNLGIDRVATTGGTYPPTHSRRCSTAITGRMVLIYTAVWHTILGVQLYPLPQTDIAIESAVFPDFAVVTNGQTDRQN